MGFAFRREREDPDEETVGMVHSTLNLELQLLRARVIREGGMVAKRLEQAVSGLVHGNMEDCRKVVSKARSRMARNWRIEEVAHDILQRHQPDRAQLQEVVASMKVFQALEDVLEHTVLVSKHARRILKQGGLLEARLIEPLFIEVGDSISLAMIAYADSNPDAARGALERAHRASTTYERISQNLTEITFEPGREKTQVLHLLFIARSLKSIVNHSEAIAERLMIVTPSETLVSN